MQGQFEVQARVPAPQYNLSASKQASIAPVPRRMAGRRWLSPPARWRLSCRRTRLSTRFASPRSTTERVEQAAARLTCRCQAGPLHAAVDILWLLAGRSEAHWTKSPHPTSPLWLPPAPLTSPPHSPPHRPALQPPPIRSPHRHPASACRRSSRPRWPPARWTLASKQFVIPWSIMRSASWMMERCTATTTRRRCPRSCTPSERRCCLTAAQRGVHRMAR